MFAVKQWGPRDPAAQPEAKGVPVLPSRVISPGTLRRRRRREQRLVVILRVP